VKAMSKATPTAFEPLPVQPLHPVADIGPLYYQPRRHQHATSPTHSRNIDALLAKHGIYPRHRTRAASLRRKPLSQNQPSVFSWRAFALTASQAYPPGSLRIRADSRR
jgi:hypothetical protein